MERHKNYDLLELVRLLSQQTLSTEYQLAAKADTPV
jgi:hypothetical protein